MKKILFAGAIGLACAFAMMAPIIVFANLPSLLVDALPAVAIGSIGVLTLAVLMPDKLVSSIGESIWAETVLPRNNLTLPRDGHSDPGRSAMLKSVIATWAFLTGAGTQCAPPNTGHRASA